MRILTGDCNVCCGSFRARQSRRRHFLAGGLVSGLPRRPRRRPRRDSKQLYGNEQPPGRRYGKGRRPASPASKTSRAAERVQFRPAFGLQATRQANSAQLEVAQLWSQERTRRFPRALIGLYLNLNDPYGKVVGESSSSVAVPQLRSPLSKRQLMTKKKGCWRIRSTANNPLRTTDQPAAVRAGLRSQFFLALNFVSCCWVTDC